MGNLQLRNSHDQRQALVSAPMHKCVYWSCIALKSINQWFIPSVFIVNIWVADLPEITSHVIYHFSAGLSCDHVSARCVCVRWSKTVLHMSSSRKCHLKVQWQIKRIYKEQSWSSRSINYTKKEETIDFSLILTLQSVIKLLKFIHSVCFVSVQRGCRWLLYLSCTEDKHHFNSLFSRLFEFLQWKPNRHVLKLKEHSLIWLSSSIGNHLVFTLCFKVQPTSVLEHDRRES